MTILIVILKQNYLYYIPWLKAPRCNIVLFIQDMVLFFTLDLIVAKSAKEIPTAL